MALFGFHLVLTMVAAAVFGKMSTRFSVCDLLLFKGLYYHLLEGSLLPRPSNAAKGGEQPRKKRKHFQKEQQPPTEREDRLFRLPLTSNALEGVPFFDSLVWTLNYSCFALAIYLISDTFCFLFPENKDLNTSPIWMLCSLVLQVLVLMRISLEKASSKELFPERNTLICAFGLFFLGSMLLNAFADRLVDMHFSRDYSQFVDSLNEFVRQHGFQPLLGESARSPLFFLLGLALLFSTIAASFFFPTLQFTSLYFDALQEASMPRILLLHLSFFAPFGVLLLFLRPVVEQILKTDVVNYDQLRAIRLFAILSMALVRALMAKTCLQTFLDQPKRKLLEYRQMEQMRAEERQRKVANFASYTAITALQYSLPVAITLSTGLILKSFGNISLLSAFTGAPAAPPVVRDDVTRIIFSKDIQEPLWTLALVTFLCVQCLCSLIGVVGRRAAFL